MNTIQMNTIQEVKNDLEIQKAREEAKEEERNRIYSFVEDRLIGVDNDLLGDLSNIIFEKEIN